MRRIGMNLMGRTCVRTCVLMCVLMTCALGTVSAQTFPDAAKLLAAQADLMKSSSTVQYTQQMDMEMTMMGTPVKTSTRTLSQYAGDKFRMESGDGGPGSTIMIYDGKTMWMYMPAQKQYSRMDVGDARDGLIGQLTSSVASTNLTDAGALARNAKVLRSEVIDIDGQPHDCWVVEVQMGKIDVPAMAGVQMVDNVSTYWLDKQSGIAQRTIISGKMDGIPGAVTMETRSTTTLHDIKINVAIPGSAFEFTPPEGAKEAPNYFATLTNRLTGKSREVAAGAKVAPRAARTPNYTPQAFVPDLTPATRVEPKYPEGAKAAKAQGEVQILATLDPSGAVVESEALAGDELLRSAAVDAVKQWRYRPVLRNGGAVYAYTLISLAVVDPAQTADGNLFFGSFSEDDQGAANRMFELMRQFPRTPQQELADLEQDIGRVSPSQRMARLPQLAKASLAAGALDKASEYADDMLRLDSKDILYAQMVYEGHTTRGLIALRQGNIALAAQDLLESAKSPGSPMLDAIGPSMNLAKELLDKGERSTVLEFLERCKSLWPKGTDRLDAWGATIRSGGVPDFGRNIAF